MNVGGVPGGRPRAQGSFARSMLGAAARGTGLIAVAVAIGIVLLQYSDDPASRLAGGGGERAADAPVGGSSTSTTVTTAAVRAPSDVTVLVLNASGRNNQARPMSERLGVVGYRTLEPGNASVRSATTVACRAGFEREGAALVAATGLPAETGELGARAGLPAEAERADCVVVIGSG